jgi:hypothetical protein
MGHSRNSDGFYHIKGHRYELLIGSRAQVMHGTAYKTTGGLTKSDLIQNKNGRIVSKKKHHSEKREGRLRKHGYTAKKGSFGAVRISSRGGTSLKMGPMNVPVVSKSAMEAANPKNLPIVQNGGYNAPSAAYSNFNKPESMIPGSFGPGTGIVTPMQRANWAAAGGSKRRRGGFSHSSLSPAYVNSNNLINAPSQASSPMRAALMASYGGRKGSRRRRRTKGGSLAMTPLNQAYSGLNEYVVPQNFTPQINALMAGA